MVTIYTRRENKLIRKNQLTTISTMINQFHFSTMPTKSTRKMRRVDDQLVLTPLKQGKRKASVEVIGDDKIPATPSMPQRIKTVEKSKLRTKRVKTQVSELYRIDLGTKYCRDDVDWNEVDWKLFHGALFETAIIFFKGADCQFDSRIQVNDVRQAKRVKLDGQVGLMLTLRSSGAVVVLRFTRRSTRNGWYNQISKLRKSSVVSTRREAVRSGDSSDDVVLTEFDEDLDDDVFEADNTGDIDSTCVSSLLPRPRTASCPSQVCLRANYIDRQKPAFRSLRISKTTPSPVPQKKKGLFKRLLKLLKK